MASMNIRSRMGRGKDRFSEVDVIKGLPTINYHLPVAVTLLAATGLFLLVGFLTLVAFGTAAQSWNASGGDTEEGIPTAFVFCGIFGLLGTLLTLYFLLALIKGARDLTMPLYYTRGSVVDKRTVAGRITGDWIGVAPSYAGPDLNSASRVTDEQAAASVDRSRIVQPRSMEPALPPLPKRSGYLSRDRISSEVELAPQPTGETGPRVVFRIDQSAYDRLHAGEEVLVAHSRFLEHIFYVAHLRDGEWESFRNKALI
ncbi:MAG: hypothetical protein WCD37_17885 [Chloroflexia bacterium]